MSCLYLFTRDTRGDRYQQHLEGNDDELVEVTPKSIRLRKRVLRANERPKKKDS